MNAVSQVGHTTMGQLLGIARTITNSDAELVWFGPDEIEDAGIAPWTELPIWVPPGGDLAGLHDCDVKRAFQTGLECRPVRETIEDTWNWLQIEGPPVQRNDRPIHGIDPHRETNLIKSLNR